MEKLYKKSNNSSKKVSFSDPVVTAEHEAPVYPKKNLTLLKRMKHVTNPVLKELLSIMHEKKTNLAVAADVTTKKELLALAHELGPHICILKTHIDIITDFDWDLIEKLQALAHKHDFLIFEDRKFADIGNTVKMQYAGGMYKIVRWAHMVNAHTIPGPGIINGLKEEGKLYGAGLILLPQMSSKGSLADGDYTKKTVQMAHDHADFVIGFIAREKLSDDPRFLHFTPGVQLQEGGDALGQQYLTPEKAIENGADVIIVGRGIIKASHPKDAVQQYKIAAWDAYQKKLRTQE